MHIFCMNNLVSMLHPELHSSPKNLLQICNHLLDSSVSKNTVYFKSLPIVCIYDGYKASKSSFMELSHCSIREYENYIYMRERLVDSPSIQNCRMLLEAFRLLPKAFRIILEQLENDSKIVLLYNITVQLWYIITECLWNCFGMILDAFRSKSLWMFSETFNLTSMHGRMYVHSTTLCACFCEAICDWVAHHQE